MMQSLTHNATALRCATRSRVCAPELDDAKTRASARGGSGSPVLSIRGMLGARRRPRGDCRPSNAILTKMIFCRRAEPRSRSAARARPGKSTRRSPGSIRSRKVSRARSCGTIARRDARWRENARECGRRKDLGLRWDEIRRPPPGTDSRSDGSRAWWSDLEVSWSWCSAAALARGHCWI